MIPTPKFRIGETVWFASTTSESVAVTCPDCLGRGTWHARTPAGRVLVLRCPTCQYTNQRTVKRVAPYVQEVTVRSVRIDTASSEPVSYMESVTGSGTVYSTVYSESSLYRSRLQAECVAASRAAALQRELDDTPEYQERARILALEVVDARIDEERRRRYQTESRLDDLIDRLSEASSIGTTVDVVSDILREFE